MQSAIAKNGNINARTTIHLVRIINGIGLFDLYPHTGKKHQLRLHMASIGLPILYDNIYPQFKPDAPRDPTAPLQLLAKQLAFTDPISGAVRVFESALSLRHGGAARLSA
jgi:tRNA pseudouridine32 synthase / 23S rRNA pseudouridine746 synthase